MEQISKCALAIRPFEVIRLLNLYLRQMPAHFSKLDELVRDEFLKGAETIHLARACLAELLSSPCKWS
jgi:hypothetical protein